MRCLARLLMVAFFGAPSILVHSQGWLMNSNRLSKTARLHGSRSSKFLRTVVVVVQEAVVITIPSLRRCGHKYYVVVCFIVPARSQICHDQIRTVYISCVLLIAPVTVSQLLKVELPYVHYNSITRNRSSLDKTLYDLLSR
jgi:hypothetical protein